MKFLIADDFEVMRYLLKNGLSAMGFSEVDEAIDGASATEKLEKAAAEGRPYDFVICDWNMPHLTGIQILEKCRQEGPYQKTPFVMLTAESDPESIVRAIKIGATDYIIKPIVAEELIRRLEKIFKRLNLKK